MAITINGTDGFSSDNSALKFDTSVFVIDETNNRIGVNTASPSQALDVTGDIEVSGGVYLGGTGSANYLDDYEEGTWTPTGFTGGTIHNARYTKVGRLVTVNLYLNGVTFTTSEIGGLPFTSVQGWGAVAIAYNNSTNINNAINVSSNTTLSMRSGLSPATSNGSTLMVTATYHAA